MFLEIDMHHNLSILQCNYNTYITFLSFLFFLKTNVKNNYRLIDRYKYVYSEITSKEKLNYH